MANPVEQTQSTALLMYHPQAQVESRSQASQQMHELFLNKSFDAQIADYRHFHRHWMGDVIVLAGTSTAGKSSIIQALRQLEPNRIEDGGDLRVSIAILEALRKSHPDQVATLENVMEPLDIPKAMEGNRTWKPHVSEEEKLASEEVIKQLKKFLDDLPQAEFEAMIENLEPRMFDEAFEHSRRGQSVIFDVLNIDAFAQHRIMRGFDGPLRAVLTYCPFHTLESRMNKRNREARESGNLDNLREGAFPFMQYSEIYSRKRPCQRTLEVITRQQAIQTFDENWDRGIAAARAKDIPLPPEGQILIDKADRRQGMLEKLGFEDGVDSVEIAPLNQQYYHSMIDSSRVTAEQSAAFLHRGRG
jgi:hypothetical protein